MGAAVGRAGHAGRRSRNPCTDVSQLPAGDIHLTGIDLTGAVMRPVELRKLEGLTHLRELYLPGPIWNPGGGKEDKTGVFKTLRTLTRSRGSLSAGTSMRRSMIGRRTTYANCSAGMT